MGLPLSKSLTGFLFLLSLLGLTSCSGSQAEPTDEQTYRFAISPAALPANGALGLCAAEALEGGASYRIETLFPIQMQADELDLVLYLTPELEAFPFVLQLGQEDLYLISHPTNSTLTVSEADLAAIFSGQTTSWSALGGDDREISLWAPTASDEGRLFLETHMLNGLPLSSNARLASSPTHMLSAVGNDEQAIGILPGAWLDNSVHSIVLGEGFPLLLSSPTQFEGPLQNLAACLQSGPGQDLLKEIYDG